MKKVLILIIKLYQTIFSPVSQILFGKSCRFTPSCSQYTIEALEKFGSIKGLLLGFKRFSKCHPWGGSGFDPIPIK